jgi:hypothetical protein
MKVSEAIAALSRYPADSEVGLFRVSNLTPKIKIVFQPLITVTKDPDDAEAAVGLAFGKPKDAK